MKIMVCPLNGPRPVIEFAYGGEVRVSVKYEWWCHLASGYWFIAQRDTARDVVLATYPAERVRGGLPP
jgi:sarcosine oxidase subunit delta